VRAGGDDGTIGQIAVIAGLELFINDAAGDLLVALKDNAVAGPVIRVDAGGAYAQEVMHQRKLLLRAGSHRGKRGKCVNSAYQECYAYQ